MKKHAGLRYESSDPSVASVSKDGKVKAVSKGKARITVYSQDGKYKEIQVIVK